MPRRRAGITALLTSSVVALAVLAVPAVASAGGGGGGGACSGFTQASIVTMRDSCFSGTAQFVSPDRDQLTVRNEGQMVHDLTAVDGSFSLRLEPGRSDTIPVPEAGITPVYCTLHGTPEGQGMAGVIIVGEVATGSDTAVEAAAFGGGNGGLQTSSGDGGGDGIVSWLSLGVAAAAGITAAVALTTARAGRRPVMEVPR